MRKWDMWQLVTLQEWDSRACHKPRSASCARAPATATLSRMSDPTNEFGPRLMAYVDAQLQGRDESPTAFAVQRVGVSASQFGRWRSGEILPRIDTICVIAEALGRPVLEVLAHTVGATEQLTEPIPAPPLSLEEAVKASDLNDAQRGLLLDVIDSLRRYERGEAEVTASNSRGRAKKRPSR